MTTQYWIVKTEPDAYSWETFVRDKRTNWDGVRNYQARNNLAAMRKGDRALFYASVSTKAILGTATVSKTAFPDTTADQDGWLAVELTVGDTLKRPVTLAEIKAHPDLADIALIRQSRLSVIPIDRATYDLIVKLGSR